MLHIITKMNELITVLKLLKNYHKNEKFHII